MAMRRPGLRALQTLRQISAEGFVDPLLDLRQVLDGELSMEMAAQGIGTRHRGHTLAECLNALLVGRSTEQHIVEVLALTRVALGLKREMFLENRAGALQGLRVGERWRIVGHEGLYCVGLFADTNNLRTRGRPSFFQQ